MLSVTYVEGHTPFMLRIILLNAVMLGVIMLSVMVTSKKVL